MGNTKKTQLAAMNASLYDFSLRAIKKAGLNTKDSNTIKQTVLYNQPYNNIEAIQSGRIYESTISLAENIVENIKDIKEK